MDAIANLKSAKAVIARMKRIQETPFEIRRKKYGRGWAWEITNGWYMLEEYFPESIPEAQRALESLHPKTLDDLYPIG